MYSTVYGAIVFANNIKLFVFNKFLLKAYRDNAPLYAPQQVAIHCFAQGHFVAVMVESEDVTPGASCSLKFKMPLQNVTSDLAI